MKLCPKCGKEPRAVSSSGNLDGYCRTCTRKQKRARYYALKGVPVPATTRAYRTDKICARCRAVPRLARGSYCRKCSNSVRARQRRKRHARGDLATELRLMILLAESFVERGELKTLNALTKLIGILKQKGRHE